MKIISFAYTVPALLANRKTCTRRAWNDDYARRFKKGDMIKAYDRSPRFGGKQVAIIQLTCDPTYEPMIEMPNSDYWAEGFGYLNENRHLLPKSMPYDVSLAGFRDWQNDGSSMWVIRFKVVEIL
jgi:hypothetical protein